MSKSGQKKLSRHMNLKALKVFEACSRHESFASAANELFVTQGAISKQIRNLEGDLGFSLFVRDSQTNTLTIEGRVLALHLTDMFDQLGGTIDQLALGLVSEPLVVSCEPTICLKLLIPLVSEILVETGVDVRVLSGGGEIDFRREHVDIAIRRNDFPIGNNLHVTTVGDEYVGAVISPTLKLCEGSVEESFVRIHTSTRSDAWLNWQEHESCDFKRDVFYDHHFLAIEAAESGQGAALLSIHMVTGSLLQNRLVAPRGFTKDGSKYICLSTSPIELDERKVKFCNWLKRKLEENISMIDGID